MVSHQVAGAAHLNQAGGSGLDGQPPDHRPSGIRHVHPHRSGGKQMLHQLRARRWWRHEAERNRCLGSVARFQHHRLTGGHACVDRHPISRIEALTCAHGRLAVRPDLEGGAKQRDHLLVDDVRRQPFQ